MEAISSYGSPSPSHHRKRKRLMKLQEEEEDEDDYVYEKKEEEPPLEDAKPIGEPVRVSRRGKNKINHFHSFEFDGNQYTLVSIFLGNAWNFIYVFFEFDDDDDVFLASHCFSVGGYCAS